MGLSGTALRFLALRLSRKRGQYRIRGEPSLLQRPHDELLKILHQLSIDAHVDEHALIIDSSDGWRPRGDTLLLDASVSSQFASSLAINAWRLPFDLYVSFRNPRQMVSKGYWQMTTSFCQSLGMRMDFWDSDFRIPKMQECDTTELTVEPDMSCAFALSAVASVSGSVSLRGIPIQSLQPDFEFISLLKIMGVDLHFDGSNLIVRGGRPLQGISASLRNCPDVFPSLAILCALAHGESLLEGAPQLAHKESHRIQKVSELLTLMGRPHRVLNDGLHVLGEPTPPRSATGYFNPEHDHRMAMAAAVALQAGYKFDLLHPHVVSKSFPNFWRCIGHQPWSH